jgi:hypothetical protein
MRTATRICAGLALAGWIAIVLLLFYSAFISDSLSHCSSNEGSFTICIPPLAVWIFLFGVFTLLCTLSALLIALIACLRAHHWALAGALFAQVIVGCLGALNLLLNGPLINALKATFQWSSDSGSGVQVLVFYVLVWLMLASTAVVLLVLPRTFPQPLRMLPALVCLAPAVVAVVLVTPGLQWTVAFAGTRGVETPRAPYMLLTALFVLGWAMATALILWANWAASHGQPAAAPTTPGAPLVPEADGGAPPRSAP